MPWNVWKKPALGEQPNYWKKPDLDSIYENFVCNSFIHIPKYSVGNMANNMSESDNWGNGATTVATDSWNGGTNSGNDNWKDDAPAAAGFTNETSAANGFGADIGDFNGDARTQGECFNCGQDGKITIVVLRHVCT